MIPVWLSGNFSVTQSTRAGLQLDFSSVGTMVHLQQHSVLGLYSQLRLKEKVTFAQIHLCHNKQN